MSFYEKFKTDPTLEVEKGITLDYGDSGQIVIHRAGGSNKRFVRTMEAKMKPYRFQIQQGTLDEEVASRVLAEVYADSVVVGWSGVKGEDGKDMAFTRENVIKLFLDLPELFRDVQQQANLVSNFRAEAKEADAKNSAASSAGN